MKYLNNVVEADRGKLKQLIRPVRGFLASRARRGRSEKLPKPRISMRPSPARCSSIVLTATARHHERSRFRCGSEALDRYLLRQASQDAPRALPTALRAHSASNAWDIHGSNPL